LSASWGTITLYAVLAMLLIALALHYVPRSAENLAAFVPQSTANNFGRQVLTDTLNYPVCVDEKGLAAFAKLLGRLESGLEKPLVYTPIVVKNDETNAFAAPGDYIVVFSGTLKDVESMDEFAGVLAHEMGHVYYNHSMRALMRYLGFSFIM